MPAMTGLEVMTASFGILNVYMPGETVSANDRTFALGVLNRMLSSWAQRAILCPVIARERFDLVANKGGEDDPYTIGPGGDFDTERPPNQKSLVSANLILTASSPEVRVPLGIYTDDAYDANQIPGMSNSQPTGIYYNPTYAGGLGSIYLWPVPDNSTNDLELFLQKYLVQFANTSTSYDMPDGWDDALVYQLAMRLAGPYGKQMAASDTQIAIEALRVVKRSNEKITDVMNDATFATANRSTLYNIRTGVG